jgi:AMIN domain-containing protein
VLVKVPVNLIAIVLTAAGAIAQSGSSAVLQNLSMAEEKGGMRVEVDLTSPVSPRVSLEANPDRLVLELPDTVPASTQAPIAVNKNGVASVRVEVGGGANSVVTRIVVLLTEVRPYEVATPEEGKVVLHVLPQESASARKRNGPVPAASAPIIGRVRRKQDQPVSDTSNTNASSITPAPVLPPISFPDDQAKTAESTAANEHSAKADVGKTSAHQSEPTAPGSEVAQPESVDSQNGVEQNAAPSQANPDVRLAFKVKYVAEGIVYLDGGSNEGLTEGMKLVVKEIDPSVKPTAGKKEDVQPIADLTVASVAQSSSVSEVHDATHPVKVGDWAYLSSDDTQSLVAQRSLSATRKYPVVVAFSEGDTLDEEARVDVPRPPLPEINRVRGSIGFDYSGVASHDGGGGLSSNAGMMIRTDITRINGTYWNLQGFWRGRINKQSYTDQQTLQDLINRTYTIGLTYDNPHSNWVAGFGRLYLPWAPSLDSIDGGYVARRLTKGVTTGIFAGSSPDPTSWSYNPDLRIGGGFVNFEGGSYDDFRYSSTSGVGLNMLKWKIDRPFVFFENGFSYKRYLSIYHSLQADSPSGNSQVAAPGAGVGRSFLTVRIEPVERVEFSINHTYFRDIPTYSAQLIGTGLLDKYLFQGFSGGVRVEAMKDLWVYTTLGRSNRSGDAKVSWNQLYGVTVGRVPWLGVRSDVHYTKFNSSFGNGSYESVSFSRIFRETLRWEVLGGRQSFVSPTLNDTSHFVTGNFEASLGRNYFVQTGYTWNRGASQNYDQWIVTFGYRFDSRANRR